MFGAVVLPTKISIALSGNAAREKIKKIFLIFLLLLVACCGKIAANYGLTVVLFHVKHNKKGKRFRFPNSILALG
jgi:hypothetical protein